VINCGSGVYLFIYLFIGRGRTRVCVMEMRDEDACFGVVFSLFRGGLGWVVAAVLGGTGVLVEGEVLEGML